MTDPADRPASDEALFDGFRTGAAPGGGRDTFSQLAARYEPALLGLACGILDGRRDAAMDAVQDAWVRVIRSAHTFDGRSTFRTWVYRIVINTCKDARQRLNAQGFQLPLPEGGGRGVGPRDAEVNGLAESSADESPHPDLHAAFADLPPDRRLLLMLCYHHNLTHPQAAAVLGVPLGTLKSRLNAALADLRARLREEARR